jgi:hypothetical protein
MRTLYRIEFKKLTRNLGSFVWCVVMNLHRIDPIGFYICSVDFVFRDLTMTKMNLL